MEKYHNKICRITSLVNPFRLCPGDRSVGGAGASNNFDVIMGTGNDRWLILPVGADQVHLICVEFGGWRLDVYGGSTKDGDPVDVTAPNQTASQIWRIQPAELDYVLIESNGRFLDVTGANKAEGTQVVHHGRTGNPSQKFWIDII